MNSSPLTVTVDESAEPPCDPCYEADHPEIAAALAGVIELQQEREAAAAAEFDREYPNIAAALPLCVENAAATSERLVAIVAELHRVEALDSRDAERLMLEPRLIRARLTVARTLFAEHPYHREQFVAAVMGERAFRARATERLTLVAEAHAAIRAALSASTQPDVVRVASVPALVDAGRRDARPQGRRAGGAATKSPDGSDSEPPLPPARRRPRPASGVAALAALSTAGREAVGS